MLSGDNGLGKPITTEDVLNQIQKDAKAEVKKIDKKVKQVKKARKTVQKKKTAVQKKKAEVTKAVKTPPKKKPNVTSAKKARASLKARARKK